MTSTPHPSDPMSGNEKLGTAAEYLTAQAATKKGDAILSVHGARVTRLAGSLRLVVRSMVHKAAVATGRSPVDKADTAGTTVEDER